MINMHECQDLSQIFFTFFVRSVRKQAETVGITRGIMYGICSEQNAVGFVYQYINQLYGNIER